MTVVIQQRVLPFRLPDWSDSVSFNQIDPSSGVTSASLSLTATITGTVSYYDSDLTPSVLNTNFLGSVVLENPGGTPLVIASPTAFVSSSRAPGGVTAPSGTVTATQAATETATYPLGNGAPYPPNTGALFGTGTVTLPVLASARIQATGPGNLTAEFLSQESASVTLTAASPDTGPAGSTDGSIFSFTNSSPNVSVGYGVAMVESGMQTATLAAQNTGWQSALAIRGFDPSLGTLRGVQVSIILNSGASLAAENLDSAASSLTVGQSTSLNLDNAAGTSLDSIGTSVSTTRALAGFDGTIDNGGASGITATGLAATATDSKMLTDAASLAAFTGTGAVGITAADTGATNISGPGNLELQTGLQAGATISVQYIYTPTVGALFDASYYLAQNPDVAAAGVDPYQHYVTFGWKEGRDPSPYFDTKYYLQQNPDVAAAGVDPLIHFAAYGWREGRDPSLVFSDAKYLASHPSAAGTDPLLDFEQSGIYVFDAGLNKDTPGGNLSFIGGGSLPADPLVNASYYDAQLGATLIPAGTAGAQAAASSYATTGWQQGLNPDAFFDTNYYLAHNPDVAAAHIDPLLHYEVFGWKEGRDPSAAFSTTKYLAAYADVKAAGVDPLLQYIQSGQAEGRQAFTA